MFWYSWAPVISYERIIQTEKKKKKKNQQTVKADCDYDDINCTKNWFIKDRK